MKNTIKKIAFKVMTNLVTIVLIGIAVRNLYDNNIISETVTISIAAVLVILAVIGVNGETSEKAREITT